MIARECTDKLARTIHEETPSVSLVEIGTVRETAARNESTSIVRFLLERSTGACVATVVDPKRRRSVLASLCPLLSTRPRGGCTEFHRSNSHTTTSPSTSRRRNDGIAISPRVEIKAEIKETPLFLLFNDTLPARWKFIDFLLS